MNGWQKESKSNRKRGRREGEQEGEEEGSLAAKVNEEWELCVRVSEG